MTQQQQQQHRHAPEHRVHLPLIGYVASRVDAHTWYEHPTVSAAASSHSSHHHHHTSVIANRVTHVDISNTLHMHLSTESVVHPDYLHMTSNITQGGNGRSRG